MVQHSMGCPVILKQMPSKDEMPPYGFPVWDPRFNHQDKFHLMPIITPAYPQQNSTYNVTYSTRSIMIDEIKRGFEICQEIFANKLEWDSLFEPRNFFNRYRHFIVLIAGSIIKEQYMDWVRLVESRIRHLVANLEKNQFISLAHVNPQGFQQENKSAEGTSTESDADQAPSNVHQTLWFVGLEFKTGNESLDLNLTDPILDFTNLVYKQAQKVGITNPAIEAKYVKRTKLKEYLPANILKLESNKNRNSRSESQSSLAVSNSTNNNNNNGAQLTAPDETNTDSSSPSTSTLGASTKSTSRLQSIFSTSNNNNNSNNAVSELKTTLLRTESHEAILSSTKGEAGTPGVELTSVFQYDKASSKNDENGVNKDSNSFQLTKNGGGGGSTNQTESEVSSPFTSGSSTDENVKFGLDDEISDRPNTNTTSANTATSTLKPSVSTSSVTTSRHKRSVSPSSSHTEVPMKRAKESNGVGTDSPVKQHNKTQNEDELLDTLPEETANFNIQSSNQQIKNPIRVNIGCNSKK